MSMASLVKPTPLVHRSSHNHSNPTSTSLSLSPVILSFPFYRMTSFLHLRVSAALRSDGDKIGSQESQGFNLLRKPVVSPASRDLDGNSSGADARHRRGPLPDHHPGPVHAPTPVQTPGPAPVLSPPALDPFLARALYLPLLLLLVAPTLAAAAPHLNAIRVLLWQPGEVAPQLLHLKELLHPQGKLPQKMILLFSTLTHSAGM